MKKGEKASPESIRLANIKRHRNYLHELDFEKWKEYGDIQLTHTNSSDLKKSCTLREFYELVKSGLSAKELIKDGYNKHLLNFYNAILKSKITISKNEFEQDYLSGMSLEEMTDKYKMSREHITFTREMFGIKRKGAKFIERKKTEKPITKRQRELIYGTLMGDGKKMSDSSLAIKHSSKVEDLVEWKRKILGDLVSERSYQKSISFDKRYGKSNESVRFYTKANTDVESILAEFYGSGKKVITQKILDNLTDFSLAVWFMDDGGTNWNYNGRIKYNWNSNPDAYLCTDGFTIDECKLMQKWFIDKYQISTYLREHRKNQFRIKFNTIETKKLLNIIKSHIIPCMGYKVDYNKYLVSRQDTCDLDENRNLKDCPTGINFANLDSEEQQSWVDAIFYKFKKHGFPYPLMSEDEIDADINAIINFDTAKLMVDNCIKYQNHSSSLLKYFNPHIYEMKNKGSLSSLDIFNDNSMLKDIIRKIILSGNVPSKSSIRQATNGYRGNKMCSIFPAHSAKAIYDHFCKDDGVAIDFCAGFGGRLIGAFASKKVRQYFACEPNVKSYGSLGDILTALKECDENDITDVRISNSTAENFLCYYNSGMADIVFTSPPYYDTEIYGNVVYNSYAKWLEWLFWCVNESLRILKDDGKLVINIADCHPYMIFDDLSKYLEKSGIRFDVMDMFLNHKRKEPLIIISK